MTQSFALRALCLAALASAACGTPNTFQNPDVGFPPSDLASNDAVEATPPDSSADAGADAADAAAEASAEASVEAALDAGLDSSLDAAVDAAEGSLDGSADVAREASPEAGPEAAADSGAEASAADAVAEASAEAGTTGRVVLLATGTTDLFAGTWRPTDTSWTTATLTDSSPSGPALAMASATSALGALRGAAGGAGTVDTTLFSGASWSAPAALGATVVTRARVTLATDGTSYYGAFHGNDFRHYFFVRSAAGAFGPVAEPVGTSGSQSFGPSPGALTVRSGTPTFAFAGNDQNLYVQERASGAWAAAVRAATDTLTLSPAIVPLTSGGELLVTYVRSTDARIQFVLRTGGLWSSPMTVNATALTSDPVALVALPGGGAVLAWRGLDQGLYWSRYSVTGWSAPAPALSPAPTLASAPALAPGVGGADAELAFVASSTGHVLHTRLRSATWSAPTDLGGAGRTEVALASAP